MIGIRELVRHKDEKYVPTKALGFAEGEVGRIREGLRRAYRTYGNLARAFGVDEVDMAECVLLSRSLLEAIAHFAVKRGKTELSKREFIALVMLTEHMAETLAEAAREMRKRMLSEENRAYL